MRSTGGALIFTAALRHVVTLYPGAMVKGRNAKTIKKLMKAAEAKEAGLLDVEIIGLRLVSGPQHVKYNGVLRALALGEKVTGSKYSTTIQVIVSAIRKLASVAKAPEDSVVYRGLRVQVAVDSEFYVLDFQGFAGGVEHGGPVAEGVDRAFEAYTGERLVASYGGRLHDMADDIVGDEVHVEFALDHVG